MIIDTLNYKNIKPVSNEVASDGLDFEALDIIFQNPDHLCKIISSEGSCEFPDENPDLLLDILPGKGFYQENAENDIEFAIHRDDIKSWYEKYNEQLVNHTGKTVYSCKIHIDDNGCLKVFIFGKNTGSNWLFDMSAILGNQPINIEQNLSGIARSMFGCGIGFASLIISQEITDQALDKMREQYRQDSVDIGSAVLDAM